MLTVFDSITTSSPLMMIDSEPGARTKAAALADVTKVGAGVTASVGEPLSGVEPPAVRSTPATDAFMTQLLGTDCEG